MFHSKKLDTNNKIQRILKLLKLTELLDTNIFLEELYALMEQLDESILIAYIAGNDELKLFFSTPRLTDLWETFLTKHLIITTPSGFFHFRLPTKIHPLDFIIGNQCWQQLSNTNDNHIPQISRDLTYHIALQKNNFQALEHFVAQVISRFERAPETISTDLHEHIQTLSLHASQWGTPGFLLIIHLISIAYLFYNQYLETQPTDVTQEEKNAIRQLFVINVLAYLNVAEQLAPQSDNDIHNAYYGQGLKASNCFSLASFDEMRKKYAAFLVYNHNHTQQMINGLVKQILSTNGQHQAMHADTKAIRFSDEEKTALLSDALEEPALLRTLFSFMTTNGIQTDTRWGFFQPLSSQEATPALKSPFPR